MMELECVGVGEMRPGEYLFLYVLLCAVVLGRCAGEYVCVGGGAGVRCCWGRPGEYVRVGGAGVGISLIIKTQ